MRPSLLPNKKEKENPDSKGTLGERYVRAIEHLKTSDMYNVITIALWNLGENCSILLVLLASKMLNFSFERRYQNEKCDKFDN